MKAAKKREEISDEEIKTAILDYEEKRSFLAESLERACRDLKELEGELYASVSMPEAGLSEPRGGSRGEDPIVPIILKKERELHRYRREFRLRIGALEEEKLRMERIHWAFQLLPWQHRRVLERLYQDRRPWKGLAEEMGVTKRTLIRLRAEAFAQIREICCRVECDAEREALPHFVAEKTAYETPELPGESGAAANKQIR